MNREWLNLLDIIFKAGQLVSPRGHDTYEVSQATTAIDMLNAPILTLPQRKLNYCFAAAEAYWILSGDDTVAGIAPYNRNIAEYSDDGQRFFGAYGPKVTAQLPYVVAKLLEDRETRQAGLTMWRECPPATKDVPCTIAMFFGIRRGKLNCHVFMRSSDVWLGLPYDVFNFSMVSYLVCCRYNSTPGAIPIYPGVLYVTAASSHLYRRNFETAEACLTAGPYGSGTQVIPDLYVNEAKLMARLEQLRRAENKHLRWWGELT